MQEQVINKIRQKLKETLPGEDAQYMMAPVKRQRPGPHELSQLNYRRGAVMLLICAGEDGNLFIPLTERFAYDGVHGGQVSFPGGKSDEADRDHFQTALRECFEEIGIESENIEILGELTALFIPASNFMVDTVVGYCALRNDQLRKNPREVKTIIKLPIESLLNENITRSGIIISADGQKIKAPYFLVEGLKVWGATAMILSEFKTVLKTIF